MESYESLIEDSMEVNFACDSGDEEFIASTCSILYSKADDEDIDKLREKLGTFAEEFIAFFSKYNGAIFFKDTLSETAGLQVHSIKNWDLITEYMLAWYDDVDEDEFDDCEIDWLNKCVAFAEIPHSGNYFVIPLAGKLCGKILYSDHDGLESTVYASSFNEFLTKFLSDPVKQIYELGCYARYSDNKTNIQWIPRKTLSIS